MQGRSLKYILALVVVLVLGFGIGRLSAAGPQASGGKLDSPGPPENTYSYTLGDIYNRLHDGTGGTKSAFTEPATGPTVGTGHTLDEIMSIAPALDNANGATQGDILAGKAAWGLTSGQWGLITGIRPLAPVPKTGQTLSFGTRDDGDLERGVPWPSPRFTDKGNGTVTDNLTGLIWLKNADCFGLENWQQALSAANTLSSGQCGLNDGSVAGNWRLPNVRELQSLIDYGVPGLPSGHPFTSVQVAFYWSSTPWSGSEYAWYVSLGDGHLFIQARTTTNYVWPVRGGE